MFVFGEAGLVLLLGKLGLQVYWSVNRGESEARILVAGDGPLSDVSLEETGGVLRLGQDRQRLADVACQQMRDRGVSITADPVYRLMSWSTGNRFVLRADRGDYSQVVGMKSYPDWQLSARVLAVCCVLESPQGFIIEKRSAKVASLPGKWHIAPSGSVQPPQSPLQTLWCEAEEELGLSPQEVLDPRCLGMIYGERSGVYQLACSARTTITFSEMMARRRSGAWEQDGFLTAPVCPVDLPVWLKAHVSSVTLGGRAILWLEGRRRWGDQWFEAQCEDRL